MRYLAAGLALTMLLVAGAVVTLAYSQMRSMMGGDADDQSGSMMGGGRMGAMMNHASTDEGQMMGSFDDERPFDLQFIDQMIMHHEGAIVSSQHMIADSERTELRELAENIQESQNEQIEQMREWRVECYGKDKVIFGVEDPMQMEGRESHGVVVEMMGV